MRQILDELLVRQFVFPSISFFLCNHISTNHYKWQTRQRHTTYTAPQAEWSTHVNTICSTASSRLHSLKVLKRCSLSTSDLLYFYTSAVRPLLEYACRAWHTSLTSEQSKQIERIQIRALKIILNSNCIDYENLCLIHNLDTLSNRRNQLCMTFFEKSVLHKSGCLYTICFHRNEMCVTDFDISPNCIYQQQELHVLVTASLFMDLTVTYKYLSTISNDVNILCVVYVFIL